MIERVVEVARAAARSGGEAIRQSFDSGFAVRSKAPADLVTEADLASEKVVVGLIREAFPDHAIISEESHAGHADAEHLWVVDPLDGTTNFVHGIPHVAVSVAYYQEGSATAGVVWNPLRDDWYEAVAGRGAIANGERVNVNTGDLTENLIGVGFYYDRGAMMQATLTALQALFEKQIHGIRRFGTAALDLCQVGTGQFGAFFEYQLSPWDFAAGRLFVEEAGGRVTDCTGAPLPLSTSSVLAASPTLYDDVLAIVKDHLPSPV